MAYEPWPKAKVNIVWGEHKGEEGYIEKYKRLPYFDINIKNGKRQIIHFDNVEFKNKDDLSDYVTYKEHQGI